ncbi:tyrosine-type recombinase/integrase [Streptosporangium sp. NPDC006013]|uniref:tyrosine-type recombinase/integrase n=1 Tax=Streptosporangium sp. NPDC006013 TaxID=3155596 RepID=UPI0033A4B471
MAAYPGARRGELLNLRWSDVDLDGKQVTITGSAAFVDGERIEGTTKSGRKRIVSLDDGTIRVLKAQRSKQAADRSGRERATTCSRPAGVSRSIPTRSTRSPQP